MKNTKERSVSVMAFNIHYSVFVPRAICFGARARAISDAGIPRLTWIGDLSLEGGNAIAPCRTGGTCSDILSVMSCLRRINIGEADDVILSYHRKITCDYHKSRL